VALPDPVFSHLDAFVSVHRYGALALKAALVQDYIYYYQHSPELPPALAEIFRNLAPADFTTAFHDAFGVDLRHLPETEARVLLYFSLTGQLPPALSRGEHDEGELDSASATMPIALALLQDPIAGQADAASLILSGVTQRLKIA